MEHLIEKTIEQRLIQINDNISECLSKVNKTVSDIQIMAVTKTVKAEKVNFVLDKGITLLGENRVQEFLSKYDIYNKNKCDIHFIGHLQSNKVKYIINKVSLIQSVDSIKLAREIDLRAKASNKEMNILLEINMANESSKNGFLTDELNESILRISEMENVKIKGLMCIPPKENSDYYFAQINDIFMGYKNKNIFNVDMQILSMGMSSDYQNALLNGSNLIRLGSAIFGERI